MLDPNSLELEIIPGILEKEWSEIEKKLELAKSFAKTVHIDIIDGKFVDNKTFLDPEPFKKYADVFLLELHMMVDDPIMYLDKWAAVGFKRFLGHIEKMPDQVAFVAKGQMLGEVGLAIDGPTSLDDIKVSLDDLDSILIYTSEKVGFSGPPLLDERLEKIKQIREQTGIPIEVDGGINHKSIKKALDSGATRFISTSHIFKSENPEKTFHHLQKLLQD